MQNKYIISGIGTDVGKTVVAAIVAEALQATYWKPVQAGDLEYTDSMRVQEWTTNVEVLPETFRLTQPMSPHAAAEIDGIVIDSFDFQVPMQSPLVIEGAGGLMVPLNNSGLTYLDIFQQWKLPVILVSRHYLGSINHTLISCELLRQREVPIAGIVFVGDENLATETIILKATGLKMIARIPLALSVDADFIRTQASRPEFQYGL